MQCSPSEAEQPGKSPGPFPAPPPISISDQLPAVREAPRPLPWHAVLLALSPLYLFSLSPGSAAADGAGGDPDPPYWQVQGAGFFVHVDEEKALILTTDYHHASSSPPYPACSAYRIQPGEHPVAEIAVDFRLQLSLFQLEWTAGHATGKPAAPLPWGSADLLPGDAVFLSEFSTEAGRFVPRAAQVVDEVVVSRAGSYWAISEPLDPGDSGTPLLDSAGRVAGIALSAEDQSNRALFADGSSVAMGLDEVRAFLHAHGVSLRGGEDAAPLPEDEVQRAVAQSVVRLTCLRRRVP